MGRKSKARVSLISNPNNENSSFNNYPFPTYKPYIDLEYKTSTGNEKYRFYFSFPHYKELSKLDSAVKIISATRRKGFTYYGLADIATKMFSNEFAINLCSFLMWYLPTNNWSRQSLVLFNVSMKKFLDSLALKRSAYKKIEEIQIEDWIDYKNNIENSELQDKKGYFGRAIKPFLNHSLTNHESELEKITYPRNIQLMPEHTSAFAPNHHTYSDAVLYQLLAQFIFHFKRVIELTKYFNQLDIKDMDENWIYPDRKSKKGTNGRTDLVELLDDWLSNEHGYRIILNHKLIYYKLLGINERQFAVRLIAWTKNHPSIKLKLNQYNDWERKYHFFPEKSAKHHVGAIYIQHTEQKIDKGIRNLAFCLVNIIMIYTGLNREVIMSWPSKFKGKSILENFDNLFLSKSEKPKEILIAGTKRRTGILTADKEISIAVVIGSPLHVMLEEYEKWGKTNYDGPFFEIPESSIKAWGEDGFSRKFHVKTDDGNLLQRLDTRKFRKVFASHQLLLHLKDIKDFEDLAERLRNDLDQNNLDTTLVNYIFKANDSMSVMDIAIVTITTEKINEALRFQGQVQNSEKPIQTKRKLFLCECINPADPSHNLPIADECKYYDLCLGCKRSVISKFHLPYICLRIIQYELKRIELGNTWTATFEDKWVVAHDALKIYIESDPNNGEKDIKAAWLMARTNQISLPPIIMAKL